jgi:hypothetical protein
MTGRCDARHGRDSDGAEQECDDQAAGVVALNDSLNDGLKRNALF